MATDLERRQQGEQFRVLDPPNFPEKPSFPNRNLFAAGGLALALALGLGLAVLQEFRDASLRTPREVESILKLPVLTMIPELSVAGGARFRNAKRKHQPA